MSDVSYVPQGFHTITPHLVIKGAAGAMDFYQRAFGAEEICRFMMPDGKMVMHGLMKIGDSMLMLGDELPDAMAICPGWVSPETNKATTVGLNLYVEDVDAVYQQAVDSGCEPTSPPMDAFWGDRHGLVRDPYGHYWGISTHKADLTEEEIKKGAEEWIAQAASA